MDTSWLVKALATPPIPEGHKIESLLPTLKWIYFRLAKHKKKRKKYMFCHRCNRKVTVRPKEINNSNVCVYDYNCVHCQAFLGVSKVMERRNP